MRAQDWPWREPKTSSGRRKKAQEGPRLVMEGAETRAKKAQEGPRLVIMMFMLMMLMMMKLEQLPTFCSGTAMLTSTVNYIECQGQAFLYC